MKKVLSLIFFSLYLVLSIAQSNLLRYNSESILNGQTFTTVWEKCYNFASITTNTYSDHDVSLFVDFTNDQANIDSSIPYNIAQNINEVHRITTTRGYVRLRIVNNSGATAIVRWGYILGDQAQLTSGISSIIQSDADGLIVRSVSSALDLSFGRFQGMSEDAKYGYSPALGTTIKIATPSTWVTLWRAGGIRTSPTSTFTAWMASTDAGDTDSPITWTYLDASGIEKDTTVNTNASDGTTPVVIATIATELYRGFNNSAITGIVYAASANNFSGGTPTNQNEILASIHPDANQTQICAGRVPAGRRRNITHIECRMLRENGGAGSVIAVFQTRKTGGQFRTKRDILVTDGQEYGRDITGIVLDPLEDYRIIIQDVSGTATYVAGVIDFEDLEN